MAAVSRWSFKRLIDELTDAQYEDMINALRAAGPALPGWTDRLAPEQDRPLPAETIRFTVPLRAMSRALALARTATRSNYIGDSAGAIWFQATEGSVRVSASDNFAAVSMDLDATVDVPGTVLVEPRDTQQITDALRKGLPRMGLDTAMLSVETEGNSHVRLAVGDRSHRSRTRPRVTTDPALPPRPVDLVEVKDGTSMRRAICHTVAAADWKARGTDDSKNLDCVGIRTTEGLVALDARNRFAAAQAHVRSSQSSASDLELFVDYLWLKQVANVIGPNAVELGAVQSATDTKMLLLSGPGWAAWTSNVTDWHARFIPSNRKPRASVTFSCDDMYGFVVDANRLATSGTAGNNSWLLKATFSSTGLDLRSVDDHESAATGTLKVPTQGQIAQPLVAHFHIDGLLKALTPFRRQEVTLHIAEDGAVLFITTPGYGPADQPPALWATSTATPREPSLSPRSSRT
jgi:hypothetical protein